MDPVQLELVSSPCNIPLPGSPSTDIHLTSTELPDHLQVPTDAAASIMVQPAQYQQQSIARHMSLDSTTAFPPPLPSPNPQSQMSATSDGRPALLSEAEDSQSTQHSGNKSKKTIHRYRKRRVSKEVVMRSVVEHLLPTQQANHQQAELYPTNQPNRNAVCQHHAEQARTTFFAAQKEKAD